MLRGIGAVYDMQLPRFYRGVGAPDIAMVIGIGTNPRQTRRVSMEVQGVAVVMVLADGFALPFFPPALVVGVRVLQFSLHAVPERHGVLYFHLD